MAYNSIAFGAATAFGPALSGILVEFAGWEYCFYINVPLGIISIVLCWLYIPKTPKLIDAKLDWFGSLLILIGLVLLILGITYIPPEKNNIILGGCCVSIGIMVIVLFVWWELRYPFAILPRSLLMSGKSSFSLLAALFNFAMLTSVSF